MSTAESRELVLFVQNDEQFYRSRLQPTYKNQINKMAKGDYDSVKADKQWQRIAREAAKEYNSKYGSGDYKNTFSKEDINLAAKEMKEDFEIDAKNGEFDELLYKKYQNQRKDELMTQDNSHQDEEKYLAENKDGVREYPPAGKGKGWHGERMRHRDAALKRRRR